jgi:hypothetical protein
MYTMSIQTHSQSLFGILSNIVHRNWSTEQGVQHLEASSDLFPMLLKHEGHTVEHGSMQFSFGTEQRFGTICVQNDKGCNCTIVPDLQQIFTNQALQRAGIQANQWDPTQGFASNCENVRRVYDYYGDLYHRAPRKMLWAGLARLGGLEVFYPSFLLLDMVRKVAAGEVVPWLTQTPLMRKLLDDMLPEAATLATLECRLLEVQKDIFEDIAWQHEAYLQGRLDVLQRCCQAGILQPCDYEAWHKINQEQCPATIGEGNKMLVRREQEKVVQPLYDTLQKELLWARWYFADQAILQPGHAMSRLAFAINKTVKSFLEAVPEGDIMNLDDRWKWIEEHVYPYWLHQHQTCPAAISIWLQDPLPETMMQVVSNRLRLFVREWLDGCR